MASKVYNSLLQNRITKHLEPILFFYLKIYIIAIRINSSLHFWKTNPTKCAVKFRVDVFKRLRIFIYTPNVYAQNRETVFTITLKTFTNFVWIEIFYVNRRNITIKTIKNNIWVAFRIKNKMIIHC